ncbi:MAG: GIY-YIG nuclease family protein, partial [Anaerolineae bacterium]
KPHPSIRCSLRSQLLRVLLLSERAVETGGQMKTTKVWVYILRCADGSYYTGRTADLEKRVAEHGAGEGSNWTKHRLPVELVFAQEMPDDHHAFLVEQQIKKWSRAKKEALIAGNWDMLRWLAKKPKFRK